ncbi:MULTISPECIES: helix-turn-helix domain-containing protein [Haladaptatus]|uniref:helix-turn-helix domain-containing protein n=1 Tax=Haladaptatus TaxID=367188 RepID=UPI0027961800|nr:HTH domain-containing protein [Haladaptatus sp. T7]
MLAIFEEVEGPVVTSGDVADALECSRETARRKLGQLEDQGKVKSRQTAAVRRYWWVVRCL